MPSHILLIRHAEKPLGEAVPNGIDEDGILDRESLTPRGWQRAGALVPFFAGPDDRLGSSRLPRPTHLFASQVGPQSSSRRPAQTIGPLAGRLGLSVDTRFQKGEIDQLAAAIGAIPGVVLVSWEHHLIGALAGSLLGQAPGTLPIWPDDRYDVVWVFSTGGGSIRFRQVAQELLVGDTPAVLV